MTSLLQPPGVRARSRKDLSAGSIPTLVEEEYNYSPPRLTATGNETPPEVRKYSDSSLPSALDNTNKHDDAQKPTKASRRSSLGLGLLGGKSDSNKSGKRRSSIAVVFLGGRRNSKVRSNVVPRSGLKNMHLSFVISQSKDPTKEKEKEKEKEEKYQRKSSESDTENDPPVTITITPDYEPSAQEKKRRRSSSWATKMERRRRKGLPALNGEIDYNGTTNGQHDEAYVRQKRHSWWNIFVPDNLKNR